MNRESLTIRDHRTRETREAPIYRGGIRAAELHAFGLVSYDPALRNTASAESAITFADGEKGILRYRGYAIEDLAEHCKFLEVAHLLLRGELPTAEQNADWSNSILERSMIHENIKRFMEGFRPDARPASMLVSTLAALSSEYPEAGDVDDADICALQSRRLIAKLPAIAAYCYRHSRGLPYVYPDPDLGYTENFLRMLWHRERHHYETNPLLARAFDILFILHADHGQSCSTNVMRAVGGGHSDPYLAVAAAAAALSGPRHGGANRQVLEMLDQIGSPAGVAAFVSHVKEGRATLAGFGHPAYQCYDPRARIVKWLTEQVFKVTGRSPKMDIALELERITVDDEYFVRRRLHPNIDLYSSILLEAMGFDPGYFSVMLAVPRTVGWLAQWQEMLSDPEQQVVRSRQIYTGYGKREFVSLRDRSVHVAMV